MVVHGENVTVLVNGEEVDHWNLTGLGYSYQDVSSCRHSGVLNQPGTVTCDAKGTFINCSERAVLRAIPQQNDLCVNSAMCTVTASTVIDHHGNTTSVEDRCAYTLLSESSVRLVGVFQERRRKDVMFLDRVIIHLDDPDIDIHLGQGGRVQANSTQLNLGDSPEEHHSVDFLKDETGVTANVSHSNSSTLVFFDGYTVHIHTTHSWMLKADRKLQGLCGNHSQSLIDTKDLEFSSFSCETRFNDTVDSSINCTTVNERCELLRGWHFAGCHAYVDPEPFITACNNTLCQYPDVDGLMCQFLEAYTKACSLENQAVDGWRATANCSTTRAFCNDTLCADHEFCAEGLSGDIRCFCRAIFVSDYRSNNSLGQPVVCSANSASISLLGCLLEEIDLDYSDLHLNDDSCRGDRDTNHMVTFRFNQSSACGAEVTANNSHVVYKNNLTAEGVTSKVIDRFDQFETFDFSCFSGQPAIQSMAFKIRANSVDQQIVSESWNYNVKMTAYTDADHRHALKPDTEIQTNQIVFVELTVYGLFDNLVDLVTDSCWATPKSSPAGALRYNMITNGCSNTDETVKVQVNGKGISTHFSFHMFHFSGQGHGIYLHCKLHLCASRNVTCGPSCGGPAKRRRRRSSRSTSADESPALISLSWTN
uniref:alpha-tectorin-like n=1 Tax=Doryrhamphus excisus TaxID=161450 RepID=UPI0025AE0D51|nr:alpha-tectorin-like [Doryrhamphus excisus]